MMVVMRIKTKVKLMSSLILGYTNVRHLNWQKKLKK